MITIKKIRTLKPRVQLRKCADVFHEAMTEETEDGYLDEVLSIVFSSDLVSAEDEEKIKRFYAKGKGIGYEDICYHILSILGDSPSDWDQKTEDGEIDWSKRKVMDHYLYLDHLLLHSIHLVWNLYLLHHFHLRLCLLRFVLYLLRFYLMYLVLLL